MTPPDTERSVERLIRLAGQRDVPTPEGTQRARRAAEQAWRQMLTQPAESAPRRGWLAMLGVALAASLVLFVMLGRGPAGAPQPLVVARIVALDGAALLSQANGESRAALNASLSPGMTVTASDGRLAIAFGNSVSLRLARGSRLRFDGGDQVTLMNGSLYVDSGGLNVATPLKIATRAGVVSHVGTQFQVLVDGALTRVRVREGRVFVAPRDAGPAQALATGDQLELEGTESRLSHGLPSFGTDWEWATTVAPVLEIENRPLAEFLTWLAREHGWQVRYSSDALQRQVAEIRLHGSLDGLDTAAILERVSLTTGVSLQTDDGSLWVGSRK